MISEIKLAVIIFHKNIHRYPKEWIQQCVDSIKNQTYKDFQVFELDYGGSGIQIYEGSNFESLELEKHVHAHNYLLDKVFSLGYNYAANINVDDFYSPERFEKQLRFMQRGYDIISSNFYNVNENSDITCEMKMHDKSIIKEQRRNHNIICHPVVCYSKHFWTTCTRLNPDEIPEDDFHLWKRSIRNYKFAIDPNFLCYYRVSDLKICNQ